MGFKEKDFGYGHDDEEFLGKSFKHGFEDGLKHRSPLSRFIVKNFFGANVTLTLVSGQTFTGEVVDGFDDVIALKQGNTITFINERFITSFI